MKNYIFRCAFLFAVAILLVISAKQTFAQNSISGMISDENRRPVSEISVELLDEFERLIRATKTKGGVYIFQGLRAGVYYIQARIAGTNYREAKERVEIGQTNRTNRTSGMISGTEALQVNLTLFFDSRGRSGALYNEVVFAQSIPVEAQNQYKNALENFDKKNKAEGTAALEKAIAVFPDYFLALDRLGNEYLRQKKFVEAENVFSKALQINSKSFSSAYGLATAQYSLQKMSDAAKTLENALFLNPASINSYFLLGKTQRKIKEYEKAEANLKKAKGLSKDKLPDIHWELALLYYHNLKRYASAADELELYLKANPKAENKEQVRKLIENFREKAKQQE